MTVLPLLAFVVPMLTLYLLNPMDQYLNLTVRQTFELMWKGRTFQLFFIWLISLELILSWENFQNNNLGKLSSPRSIAFFAALVAPTVYVLASYWAGLNAAIVNWAIQNGVTFAQTMPLSTEYLSFATIFLSIVFLQKGLKGLKDFSVPFFFLIAVGALYTIDNIFPYGQFTPFQILVPTTTMLASALLSSMGYTTTISYGQTYTPSLTATETLNPAHTASFTIAWPCAGIESFLIFTVVILLFLKRMNINWKAKIGYFIFGAAITYLINAMRIVTIFTTAMQHGVGSWDVDMVHFYYGPLYAVTWIALYPLLIFGSQALWRHIKKRRSSKQPQQALPNAV